jgi:beta-lactam-binding protein with PASTA domain
MNKTEQAGWLDYIRTKDFRYTLVAILIFLGIVLLVAFLWLKWYTHHGQQLQMPDYTGFAYEEAVRDAKSHKFRMSIQDSVHILGKPGGEIIRQNPSPGSMVKQKRMIYVTITKRSPDQILSGRLPEMYGKNFDRKKRELEEHFEIKSHIIDTRFDPGEPRQILEVQYKGKTIIDSRGRDNTVYVEKGDALDFVISSQTGGKVEIPNLICKTYEEARFILENLGLNVGDIIHQGDAENPDASYVISQSPAADGNVIEMESAIQLTLSPSKPGSCP